MANWHLFHTASGTQVYLCKTYRCICASPTPFGVVYGWLYQLTSRYDSELAVKLAVMAVTWAKMGV